MKVSVLLALVAERGMRVELGADGEPRLRGPVENATPTMLSVLKKRREEIIKHLGGNPIAQPTTPAVRVREWLWVAGNYYVEAEWVAAMPQYDGRHPWGAAWWRYRGGAEWQALPDAGGANIDNALALARQKGHPL